MHVDGLHTDAASFCKLVAEQARSTTRVIWWGSRDHRDREIDRSDLLVDEDAIPHWSGVETEHLRHFEARVKLEYETILGDSVLANERRSNVATAPDCGA